MTARKSHAVCFFLHLSVFTYWSVDYKQFTLRNVMQRDFVIDVIKPGSQSLVSRRRTDGVTFAIEPAREGRLRTLAGLCVHTDPGTFRSMPSAQFSHYVWKRSTHNAAYNN